MNTYDTFAPFYDLVVGPRDDEAQFLQQLLAQHAPTAHRVLELGCGTGSVLKVLARHYETTGIDRAAGMLAIAAQKSPASHLIKGDISSFHCAALFDAIVCPFDTMNHLSSFPQWESVLRQVHKHLSVDGVFVFDVNTSVKLQRYLEEPAVTRMTEEHIAIVAISRLTDDRYRVTHRLLQKTNSDLYRSYELVQDELIIAPERIRSALKTFFKKIQIIDPDRVRPSKNSEELYFVCSSPRNL